MNSYYYGTKVLWTNELNFQFFTILVFLKKLFVTLVCRLDTVKYCLVTYHTENLRVIYRQLITFFPTQLGIFYNLNLYSNK